jgi:hypothetical protein
MKARNDRRRWAVRALVASSVIGVVGVGVALAEDMWVNRPFVEIWAGKGSVYGLVTKADQGAKLTVIEHDGIWLKVQYNGQEGYVMEKALSARQVGGDQMSGLHDSQSSGMSSGNAGKGFTPEDFAQKKGYSEEPLKQLEADKARVFTPQQWEKFTADGKVGPNKPA